MNNQSPSNIFTNPFKPPLKDNHYFPSDSSDIRGVPRIPINIRTQALDTHYKQVGILTRITGPETITPETYFFLTVKLGYNHYLFDVVSRTVVSGFDFYISSEHISVPPPTPLTFLLAKSQ